MLVAPAQDLRKKNSESGAQEENLPEEINQTIMEHSEKDEEEEEIEKMTSEEPAIDGMPKKSRRAAAKYVGLNPREGKCS